MIKKPCEFCKVDDGWADGEYFIADHVNLHEKRSFTDEYGVLSAGVDFDEDIVVTATINGEGGELWFSVFIDGIDGRGEESPLDYNKSVKIKYCPMCGRKFK